MLDLSLEKVAGLSLNVKTLGIKQNLENILKAAHEAKALGKNALFTGELSVTGVECQDMFLHPGFIKKVEAEIAEFAKKLPDDFIVGLGHPMFAKGLADKAMPHGAPHMEHPAGHSHGPHGHGPHAEGACPHHGPHGEGHGPHGHGPHGHGPHGAGACPHHGAVHKVTGVTMGAAGAKVVNTYSLVSKEGTLFTLPGKLSRVSSRTDSSSRYFVSAYDLPNFDMVRDCIFDYHGQKIMVLLGDFNSPDPAALVKVREFMAAHSKEVCYILSPNAVGYELDKPQQRERDVQAMARHCELKVLAPNNVGCESGGVIYDGQCIMADINGLVARNEIFSFKPYEIVTVETGVKPLLPQESEILKAVALGLYDWLKKTYSKGYALSMSGGADSALCATTFALSQVYALLHLGVEAYAHELKSLSVHADVEAFKEEIKKLGVSLDKPLIDTIDQATLDKVVAVMKQCLMPDLLVCVYQGSEFSGSVTEQAATEMAKGVGAKFYKWSIAPMVKDYITTMQDTIGYDLTWEKDDIALQNIQARSRLPSIWLMANHKGFLLMATSNLSEAAVGYCTMDGDTAGGLSPIAGIGKSRILKINRSIAENGIKLTEKGLVYSLPQMSYIVAQAPTAELRPGGEQTDEKDLMPYPLLDTIRTLFAQDCMMPEEITELLLKEKNGAYKSVTTDLGLDDDAIKLSVKRFFALFQRNQWKRERYATGFHIEKDDASPKSYLRFPVLSQTLLAN